jgi:uncharacterized protein YuzE
MEQTKHKINWIFKQQRDVQKVFSPIIDYDREYDILYITWFPQLKCTYSLETLNDIIFDLTQDDQIKGIEIMDFKRRFMNDILPYPKG